MRVHPLLPFTLALAWLAPHAATALGAEPGALAAYRAAIAGYESANWDELAAGLASARAPGALEGWGLRGAVAEVDALARSAHGAQAAARARELASGALPDWALWVLARALPASEGATSRSLLQRLLAQTPASCLRPDALMALAEGAGDDPTTARAGWARIVRDYPRDPLGERAMARLTAGGSKAERLAWARRYREAYPEGANRFDVARTMAALGPLSESERLGLAADLMESSDYGPAKSLLSGLNSALARFRLGRAVWRLGDAAAAERLITAAVQQDPSLARRAEIVLGQIAEKRHDRPGAIDHYRRAARSSGDEALEALTKLGTLYRRQDDEAGADPVDREIVSRFPASEEATEARFRLFWRSYLANQRGEAARWATAMGTASPVKVEGPAGLYWLGRLKEQAGNYSQAADAYREAMARSPRSYYGWRSRFRSDAIRASAGDPGFALQSVEPRAVELNLAALVDLGLKPGSDYVAGARALPAALRELVYLGRVEPALRWEARHDAPANLVAWLALCGGRYRESILHSDGTDPLLSYPLGYYPLVRQAANLQGLDPLLLLSLVKQESLFDPGSRSWVGAVGLSQVMPDTAQWVGRKVPGPQRALSDPFWNLKLGAYYLGYVQRRLANQPLFAVAAYNAGPNAVQKWIDAFGGNDADLWVERVPYPETRHYIKKVFGNYWTYQHLYGDRP